MAQTEEWIAARELERRHAHAAAQRRLWESQGSATLCAYAQTRGAPPPQIIIEIVNRHRGGKKRHEILREVGDLHPGLTEYAIKRIIRVYAADRAAFNRHLTDDIVTPR